MNAFGVGLCELQPSQLYINSEKLAEVERMALDGGPPVGPLPVRRLDGRLVLTDGHTRALAAHRSGCTRVLVCPEMEELDWDAYRICVGWCRDEGIHSVPDLEQRVIPATCYGELWLERCRAMHRDLARRREE